MFKFKGISSTDMQVIIEEEEHFIARAAKRYEVTEIEGRDGAIFNELGYSYVERPIYVQCLNINKIDDILAWLDGEGEFEYKGRKTIARFYSELEPKREGYIRIIDTTFIRDPFWIKANDELVTVKESKVAETEESKSIHIEDASTIPAQLEVLGNQEQKTRSGKNLLNLRTQSVNGITTTKNTDGTLNIKGTATANGNIGFLNKNIILEANKSYTFSIKKISGQNFNNSVWFWNTTDSNSEITINLNNNTKTVTYDHEVTITAVNMTVNAGNVFDVTLALQVEEGTVATEYEQYGASPSPDYPSLVKCLGSNKQLFDKSNMNVLTGYIDGNGTMQYNTSNKTAYIGCPKNTNITVSGKYLRGIACYNQLPTYGSQTSVKNINQSTALTINTGENIYLAIWYYANTTEYTEQEIIDSIKVEEGTETTSYSPYGQGSTEIKIRSEDETEEISKVLNIQQEMLKGDYFIKEADGWKEVHSYPKKIFDGTENINLESLSQGNNFYINIPDALGDTTAPVYSNCFMYYNGLLDKNYSCRISGSKNLNLRCNEKNTAEEFKQMLADKYNTGNPVYAFYKTATPTKLACTEEQSAVLEELNNLKLFERVNNIITAEDIALLKLKYMKITNEKISNEGNVESRPILRLEKTSTESVELTINNCRFKYNFNDEEYVEIDCEEKEVKYEGLNRNRQIEIGYEFPILNVGDNDIKMHSGDCVIKVLRKDRWL